MVKPFLFSRLPKIFFKNGIIAELPGLVTQFGRRLILVTGKRSFIGSMQAEMLLQSFKEKDVVCHILSVSGEPSPETIDEAVGRYRNTEIDLVVGAGGGSVMDTGKALSAMMYRSESVVDYLEGIGIKEHPGTKLPYIAIPTTSGTGSEATKNAVISRIGKEGFKRSLRHDNFVPDIALVDPELTLHCPKDIMAASGMDCFTQLTEAYLSDKSSQFTDAWALEGLKVIKSSLLNCYNDSGDIEARSGMSFAALTSGICLANAGLGAVHGFASSIGGMYEIPHGLICGTLMAPANDANIRELRKHNNNPEALRKYSVLGRLFEEVTGRSEEYYQDSFISYLYRITDDLHLQGLGKSGFDEKDIESVCSKTDIKNNPVKLAEVDLAWILNKGL
jgi:alcohol dehydrogenase class IV